MSDVKHQCFFVFSGHILRSSDKSVEGKYDWECECGEHQYSDGIGPTGKIITRTPKRERKL